jgi:hypothetical protein
MFVVAVNAHIDQDVSVTSNLPVSEMKNDHDQCNTHLRGISAPFVSWTGLGMSGAHVCSRLRNSDSGNWWVSDVVPNLVHSQNRRKRIDEHLPVSSRGVSRQQNLMGDKTGGVMIVLEACLGA